MKFTRPLRGCHSLVAKSHSHIVALVVLLNLVCAPSTIHRPSVGDAFFALPARVVAVVVDSVDGQFCAGAPANNADKRAIIAHSITDANSPPGVTWMIPAPRVYSGPDGVLGLSYGASRPAMGGIGYLREFNAEASTRPAFASYEVPCVDSSGFSTLAFTVPQNLGASFGHAPDWPVHHGPATVNPPLQVRLFGFRDEFPVLASARVDEPTSQVASKDALFFAAHATANPSCPPVCCALVNLDHLKETEGFADQVCDWLLVLAGKFRRDNVVWGLAHGYNMWSGSSEGWASARRSALAFIIPVSNKPTRRIV